MRFRFFLLCFVVVGYAGMRVFDSPTLRDFDTTPVVAYNTKVTRTPVLIVVYALAGHILDEKYWIHEPAHPLTSECRTLCEFSWDRRRTAQADAVLYHGRSKYFFPEHYPLSNGRFPNVVYIMAEVEGVNTTHYAEDQQPNKTATTDMHSSIPITFSKFGEGREFLTDAAQLHQMFCAKVSASELEGRREAASFFASNCHGPRVEYVRELSNYFPLENFSPCLAQTSSMSYAAKRNDFYGMQRVNEQLLFCLAFDNTNLYTGYLSERLIQTLESGCIPIYWGGMRNIEALFPANSFINANSYSPKALATFLRRVSHNSTALSEFHTWRTLRRVPRAFERYLNSSMPSFPCRLCLHLGQSGYT